MHSVHSPGLFLVHLCDKSHNLFMSIRFFLEMKRSLLLFLLLLAVSVGLRTAHLPSAATNSSNGSKTTVPVATSTAKPTAAGTATTIPAAKARPSGFASATSPPRRILFRPLVRSLARGLHRVPYLHLPRFGRGQILEVKYTPNYEVACRQWEKECPAIGIPAAGYFITPEARRYSIAAHNRVMASEFHEELPKRFRIAAKTPLPSGSASVSCRLFATAPAPVIQPFPAGRAPLRTPGGNPRNSNSPAPFPTATW